MNENGTANVGTVTSGYDIIASFGASNDNNWTNVGAVIDPMIMAIVRSSIPK